VDFEEGAKIVSLCYTAIGKGKEQMSRKLFFVLRRGGIKCEG
jgi:hypothetical protein